MTKQELIESINDFLVKLPVGLRPRAFNFVQLQGIRDEFAALGCQLRYVLNEVRSELREECDRLIKEHERFVRGVNVGVSQSIDR